MWKKQIFTIVYNAVNVYIRGDVCFRERAMTVSHSLISIHLIYHRATKVFIARDITGTSSCGGEELRRIAERKSSETRKIKRRPLFFNKTCPGRFSRCRFSPGGSSLDFSQPQFHKNSLKKKVGAQECARGKRNIRPPRLASGRVEKERCQLGCKQATSLSSITLADLPMSWRSKFISPLRTKLFFYQKGTLTLLNKTGAVIRN